MARENGVTKLFVRAACVALSLVAAGSVSASAADSDNPPDLLPSEPFSWSIGNLDVNVGGLAGGALSYAWQQDGYDRAQAGGELRSWLRVQRTFDNGMILGARTDLLLAHDRLSGDIYDNDTVERLFLFWQMGFGRVEVGQQDGAAYTLALTGPEIDPLISLEARHISLFRNPVTGRDFGQFFKQVTAVQTSSNYAKINYLTPRILGIQIGASFTPETVRSPLPWTGNPRNNANEQHNIWEVGASYTGYVSGVAVGLTAGYAQGNQRENTLQGANLYDWSVGGELAYLLDETKLTIGGAYRETNAWLLDVDEALRGARTGGEHLSASLENGRWRLGAETSVAHASGPVDYGITGYQATLGYQFTPAIELTGGWQWYHYARNAGLFYNDRRTIRMDAGYIGLSYIL
jgi:predicted porin